MHTFMTDIARLVPYARNPRNNEAAVDKVAASLREFGWKQPIVVDNEMTVVAGHTRLLAAKKLGMAQVPIVVADDLTAEQVKAYRLADNRIAEDSTWDMEMLGLEMKELDSFDFDMGVMGFDEREIDRLLNFGGDSEKEDAAPPVQDQAVSETGDLWLLGKHRLLCGDCTVAADVAKVLDGVVPTLMVTDPPYGVNYDAAWRNDAAAKGYLDYSGKRVGLVENDDRVDWLKAWILFAGDVVYCWYAAGRFEIDSAKALEKAGFEIRNQIIWSKPHSPISRGHYTYQHEPCWYAVRKSQKANWHGPNNASTVWSIALDPNVEGGHSTQKPVECMRRPIVNNTSPGQAVYDPFMGSGTTIIAGEKEGRPVYGVEINPLYVDVCVRRWQEYTGNVAKLVTGETFQEIEDKRH